MRCHTWPKVWSSIHALSKTIVNYGSESNESSLLPTLFGSVWIQLKTENWKLKLKIEKYCSKIIFKCVNSTVGPIFNEKVAEKWNLWICEQYMMCFDWLKKVWKVKICGYCLLNSTWTVTASLKNVWKKKKKKKGKTANALIFSAIQTQLLSQKMFASTSIFKNTNCLFSLNHFITTCHSSILKLEETGDFKIRGEPFPFFNIPKIRAKTPEISLV